jgi:hypothetical protein
MKTTTKVAMAMAITWPALVTACAPSAPDAAGAAPAAAGNPGAADPPVASECPAPREASPPGDAAGPTQHAGRVADETWTADASPHLVTADTLVAGTLTIEPCAEVLIADGKTLSVAGRLIAEGTASKRIHIGAADASKPFASIHGTKGTLSFAYATVDGGGAPLNALPHLAGAIDVQGTDPSKPTQEMLKVDHVTVEGSASNGIVLRDGAGFATGSRNLVVHGAAIHPISVWSRAAGTVPAGTYTGNGIDEILLPATSGYESVAESTTFHDRGVPYRVGHETSNGYLRVVALPAGPTPTLTIEPGVTLRFVKGGVLVVDPAMGITPARGVLVAAGTDDKKITFTSAAASPAAGDWLGVWFGMLPDPASRIDHAVVAYAGGSSASGSDSCVVTDNAPTNDAAVRILGVPSTEIVTNTLVRASASNGIDRGWRADLKTDFLPTNTFESIGRCTETWPRDSNGACPVVPPCPMQ